MIYPSGGGDLPNLNNSPRAPVGAKKLKTEIMGYILSTLLSPIWASSWVYLIHFWGEKKVHKRAQWRAKKITPREPKGELNSIFRRDLKREFRIELSLKSRLLRRYVEERRRYNEEDISKESLRESSRVNPRELCSLPLFSALSWASSLPDLSLKFPLKNANWCMFNNFHKKRILRGTNRRGKVVIKQNKHCFTLQTMWLLLAWGCSLIHFSL